MSSQPSSHGLGVGSPARAPGQALASFHLLGKCHLFSWQVSELLLLFVWFGCFVFRRRQGARLSQMPESVNSAPGKALLTCPGGSGATRLTTWTPSGVVVRAWAQWESPPLGHVTSQGALDKSLKLQASVFPSVKWAWQRRPRRQEEDMLEAQSRPPEMLQPPALIWPRLCQQGGTISLSLIKALIND